MNTSSTLDIKKILLVIALLIGVLSLIPVKPQNQARAQIGGGVTGSTPYGGQRFVTITCDCSGNFWILLLDYKTPSILALLYQPGISKLYEYYNVWFATYLLGTYQSGGTCQIVIGTGCAEITSQGMLDSSPGTGTSLL
jgi:hypothetical protein